MMTSYLYAGNRQSNSHYFLKHLLQKGMSCYAIALESKLTIDTLFDVLRYPNMELDLLSFQHLLGYYCLHLPRLSKQAIPFSEKVAHDDRSIIQKSALFETIATQPWHYLKPCAKRLLIQDHHQNQSYLTVREQQVLYFLLREVSREECAFLLDISERTVEFHWRNIKNRLPVFKLSQLWLYWKPL